MALLNTVPQDNLLDSPGSSVFDLPPQQDRDGLAGVSDARDGLPGAGDHTASTAGDGPSFIVISGGTGCNSICSAFGNATYVLPVSDDGGSSSEIIRVIGGPSVGEHPRCNEHTSVLYCAY